MFVLFFWRVAKVMYFFPNHFGLSCAYNSNFTTDPGRLISLIVVVLFLEVAKVSYFFPDHLWSVMRVIFHRLERARRVP